MGGPFFCRLDLLKRSNMYDEEIVRKNVLKCSVRSTHFLCTYHASLFKSGEKNRGIEIDFAITEVLQNVLTAYCLNLYSFSRQILTTLTKWKQSCNNSGAFLMIILQCQVCFRCFLALYIRVLIGLKSTWCLVTQLLAPQSTAIHTVTWPGEHMQIVQKFFNHSLVRFPDS